MEKITAEQAIRLLKNSPIENAIHIDSIRYFIEDEENAEYFCSENVLIIADITSKETYINVVPFTGEWNMAECEAFLHPRLNFCCLSPFQSVYRNWTYQVPFFLSLNAAIRPLLLIFTGSVEFFVEEFAVDPSGDSDAAGRFQFLVQPFDELVRIRNRNAQFLRNFVHTHKDFFCHRVSFLDLRFIIKLICLAYLYYTIHFCLYRVLRRESN